MIEICNIIVSKKIKKELNPNLIFNENKYSVPYTPDKPKGPDTNLLYYLYSKNYYQHPLTYFYTKYFYNMLILISLW